MQHNLKAAAHFVEAFAWHENIDVFVRKIITERPILHVCAGPNSDFGDVRLDRYIAVKSPGVIADWRQMPFADDAFGCVFADPPWNIGYMKQCADFCKHALQVAPVLYLMAPWLWVKAGVRRDKIWLREFPGVNVPVLIVRYERQNRNQMSLFGQ